MDEEFHCKDYSTLLFRWRTFVRFLEREAAKEASIIFLRKVYAKQKPKKEMLGPAEEL